MGTTMKRWLVGVFVLSLVCGALPSVAAAAFPEQPITIIVGRGAGGSTDAVARTFAPFFSKHLGVPVVVKNVKGAGGRVALSAHYKGKPDGYELIIGVTPSDITKALLKPPPYDYKKFTYIYGIAGGDTNGLSVPAASKMKSFSEVLEVAKKEPITLGGTGIGSNSWLLALQLREKAGLKYAYVPFDSGRESTMALVGGHLTTCISSSIDAPALVKAGKIRVLGVASNKRISYLPDVPTFAELGYRGVNTETRQFVMGPPNLPDTVKKVLSDAAAKAVADPKFMEVASKSFTVDAVGPDELGKVVLTTFENTAELLKAAGEIK